MDDDEMELFEEAISGMPCVKETNCAKKYEQLLDHVCELQEDIEGYEGEIDYLEEKVENLKIINHAKDETIETLKKLNDKLVFNIEFMQKEIEFLHQSLINERKKK